MPSVSKKQERFMQAVAHNPAFAKKAGVPQSVGKEFTKSGGGMAESKAMVKKEVSFMKKKGAPKSMIAHEKGEMMGMKKAVCLSLLKAALLLPRWAQLKLLLLAVMALLLKAKPKASRLSWLATRR